MIYVHADPHGVIPPRSESFEFNVSIQDNIERLYPKGLNLKTTNIFLNGKIINPLEYDLSRKPTALDKLDIVFRQQGTEIIVGIITFVVSMVAAIVIASMTPNPTIPSQTGEARDSPNNNFSGQTNRARKNQPVPYIVGCVRSFPDLIQPSIYWYENNRKRIREHMCIGIGEYSYGAMKYSETKLSDMDGASATFFKPGDVIPEIIEGFLAPDIDGQNLPGPGEAQATTLDETTTSITSMKWDLGRREAWWHDTQWRSTTGEIRLPVKTNQHLVDIVNYLKLETDVKAIITFTQGVCFQWYDPTQGTWGGDTSGWSFGSKRRSSLCTLKSIQESNGEWIIRFSDLPTNAWEEAGYAHGGYYWRWNSICYADSLRIQVQAGGWVGPFIAPVKCEQLWFNFRFPAGLKGSESSVAFAIEVWAVTTSNVEILGTRTRTNVTHSADSFTPQFRTKRVKLKKGYKKYAYRVMRLTPTSNSTTVGQAQLESVFAINIRRNVKVNDTLVIVETGATANATGGKERKFNVEVTRMMISYDQKKKKVDYTLRPSRSFADAVLHTHIILAKKKPESLAIDELYAISDSIKAVDECLGYHDFTYDDKNVSHIQRLETICNSARVNVYYDGLQYRFVRDEKKSFPVVQFDARNLANEHYTRQPKRRRPDSYDGVELEYIDPADANEDGTDRKAFIKLKIDNDRKRIIEDEPANQLRIQLAGCRNYRQAMNRAQLEVRKLLYQNTFVECVALCDANIAPLGERVRWSDPYSNVTESGEIVEINGDEFTADHDLNLTDGLDYRVCITDGTGYPSPWLEFKLIESDRFRCSFTKAYIADGDRVQAGSRFIITPTRGSIVHDYILTKKKPNSPGQTTLSLAEYNDKIYEYDAVTEKEAAYQRLFYSREYYEKYESYQDFLI